LLPNRALAEPFDLRSAEISAGLALSFRSSGVLQPRLSPEHGGAGGLEMGSGARRSLALETLPLLRMPARPAGQRGHRLAVFPGTRLRQRAWVHRGGEAIGLISQGLEDG